MSGGNSDSPFEGFFHVVETETVGGDIYKEITQSDSLQSFLLQNIKKLVLGEGITEIGYRAFMELPALEDVQFSSTIVDIEDQAFLLTGWLLDLYDESGYYSLTQSMVVDVVINGITFNLHANENW